MANKKRLIDANALSKEVDKSKHNNPHPPGMVRVNHRNEHDHFSRMIYDAPTVYAVEVVHGQWRYGYCVHNGKVVYHSINCSECDGVFRDKSLEIVQHWESQFKICPFCGAKMDGDLSG